MPHVHRLTLSVLTVGFCVALASKSATAAVLLVNGSGILTGATGVNLNGTLYDVEFVDGTCVAVFDGCDELSDFPFFLGNQIEAEANTLAASQALLDQVFLDTAQGSFDSNPGLTFGCSGASPPLSCGVITPLLFEEFGVILRVGSASNGSVTADFAAIGPFPYALDTSEFDEVWARWSPAAEAPVPEPTTLTLLGLGLAGIGARSWRHRKAS